MYAHELSPDGTAPTSPAPSTPSLIIKEPKEIPQGMEEVGEETANDQEAGQPVQADNAQAEDAAEPSRAVDLPRLSAVQPPSTPAGRELAR